ncbi:putative membrane protein [Glaciihabitans tibetensis]|uniref:Putative membrane protein n=1 Tax=Glaciihabitans tibetensis TaxID=1266600 RepID=A0A2T0VB74_9MICO|nr:EamA family transporter [Glaciihabitans tibetensis]PRY67404.1 putative membrane protein [Glaciihabitans tibetensis]
MFPVAVGIVSALIFGAADFLGGLGSKRISPIRVTAVAGAAGLVVLLLAYPVIGGAWSPETIVLGALSGMSGALAISLLYACLAVGPMSILSPLTALVSAIVPLTVGLAQGEQLGSLGYVAIGCALVAVVLVGFVREKNAVRPTLRGILMAIGSGTMIGLFLVIIDLTPADSGIVPLIVNRAVNSALMFATVGVLFLWARRRRGGRAGGDPYVDEYVSDGRGWRPGLQFAIACGIVDAVANAGLLWGLRIGELSVMSVLTALYPAGTIILAAVVLKERIAVVQYVGLVLAVAAGAMFALA